MNWDSNPLKPISFYKQNSFLIKLLILFLLFGLTIRFFSSYSIDFSSPVLEIKTSSPETDLLTFDKDSRVKSQAAGRRTPRLSLLLTDDCDFLEHFWNKSQKSSNFSSPNSKPISEDIEDEEDIESPNVIQPPLESNSQPHGASTSNVGVEDRVYDVELLPHDPGKRIPILGYPSNDQDAVRRGYIAKKRCDPRTHNFPQRSIGGSLTSNSTNLIEDEAKSKCDLFKGEWIPNPSGPVYNNNSCPFIELPQNCMTNGRPDSDYLYWRWSPLDCKLDKFNPEKFLDMMSNKYWAFIGDSISRNHVQSFLCTLSQVDQAKEIYHDEEYKSKTWVFPLYNFTVAVIWSPYLVKAEIFEDNDGVSTSETQLHLDKLDEKWTSRYNNFDYVIIAGGKWFLKTAIYFENNTIQGCHYCHGRNLTELGFDHAYRKALELVLNFVMNSSHKAQVFLRTITPDHFENGEWHNGGTCNRKVPFKEGEVNITDIDRILYEVELQEFDKAIGVASEKGVSLKLFDTTRLSLLRPDGHPGPYRQSHPFAKDKNAKVQYDCLHWCLPGPIDSWNDLVMDILMND